MWFYYGYYAMLLYDRKVGFWKNEASVLKAIGVYVILETWILLALYFYGAFAFHWPKRFNLNNGVALIWVLLLVIANGYLLAKSKRAIEFRQLFEKWQPDRQRLWSYYWLIGACVIFCVFACSMYLTH